MLHVIGLLLTSLLRCFRSRQSLLLENLVLRQQLAVLKRKHPRPRLAPADKLFWVLARLFWSSWKQALILVSPDTESGAVPADNDGRLTNLTQLTIDTSFWSRYRSITNPDFDPNAPFVQAVPSLNSKGTQHTAIPRTNQDTKNSTITADNAQSISTHLQAIAFTAGFHFAFIEQGGTSLYPTLALQASNLEVLSILLSIGPSETMHFQTWQDKAGNALPISDTDNVPGGTGATVTFSTLSQAQGEEVPESLAGDTLQANLIMPEPTHFLDADDLGPVAIIRPTSTKFSGAAAAVQAFIDDGLFIGQPKEFTDVLFDMAHKADDAKREF